MRLLDFHQSRGAFDHAVAYIRCCVTKRTPERLRSRGNFMRKPDFIITFSSPEWPGRNAGEDLIAVVILAKYFVGDLRSDLR